MTAAPSHDIIDSPIGPLTLVERDGALCGLYMDGHRRWAPDQAAMGRRRPEALRPVAQQLGEYFAGERIAFDLPLGAAGSAFQHEVWGLLRTIPYGETTTYGVMAERLGRPGAARAVGWANGSNPISIIVPCHRVIGAGGKLTGYGGGLERKQALLDLEQARDNPRLW